MITPDLDTDSELDQDAGSTPPSSTRPDGSSRHQRSEPVVYQPMPETEFEAWA